MGKHVIEVEWKIGTLVMTLRASCFFVEEKTLRFKRYDYRLIAGFAFWVFELQFSDVVRYFTMNLAEVKGLLGVLDLDTCGHGCGAFCGSLGGEIALAVFGRSFKTGGQINVRGEELPLESGEGVEGVGHEASLR
jgi:hypothetical protein